MEPFPEHRVSEAGLLAMLLFGAVVGNTFLLSERSSQVVTLQDQLETAILEARKWRSIHYENSIRIAEADAAYFNLAENTTLLNKEKDRLENIVEFYRVKKAEPQVISIFVESFDIRNHTIAGLKPNSTVVIMGPATDDYPNGFAIARAKADENGVARITANNYYAREKS